jgi:hypothetical protein
MLAAVPSNSQQQKQHQTKTKLRNAVITQTNEKVAQFTANIVKLTAVIDLQTIIAQKYYRVDRFMLILRQIARCCVKQLLSPHQRYRKNCCWNNNCFNTTISYNYCHDG